jgi:thiol-disulfide isomerase/thioredoxin
MQSRGPGLLLCLFLCSCAAVSGANAGPGRSARPAVVRATESLPRSGEAEVSEAAPWLSGWTIDEQVWNLKRALADSLTTRVALVFFATWCPPCREGIARLTARAGELRAAGVGVVLVDFKEDAQKVRRFVGSSPAFPVVLDRFGSAEKAYLRSGDGPVKLPRTIVIGRDGVVRAIFGTEGGDYVDRVLAAR